MPTYVYGAEDARYYPYPPLIREFADGDKIDLDEAQVPRDGRFWLKGPGGERLPLPPHPPAEPGPAEPDATEPAAEDPPDPATAAKPKPTAKPKEA